MNVSGSILGDITATPNSVAMGIGDINHKLRTNVTITAIKSSILEGLKISCTDPQVSAKLVRQSNGTDNLSISFKPKASGALQTIVEVSAPNGQILDIPVSAWVN
jgi:hypothetical protein